MLRAMRAGSWPHPTRRPPAFWLHLSNRLERRPQFAHECVRLFPGGEMAALRQAVVVDELGKRLLGPAPGRRVDLVGKGADGHRDGDVLRCEEWELVLPEEPCGRH